MPGSNKGPDTSQTMCRGVAILELRFLPQRPLASRSPLPSVSLFSARLLSGKTLLSYQGIPSLSLQ